MAAPARACYPRAESQCDRSCDAYVSRYIGYHAGLPEAERLALMKRAAKMRTDVAKSQGRLDMKTAPQFALDAADDGGQASADDQKPMPPPPACPSSSTRSNRAPGGMQCASDAERRMREIARTFRSTNAARPSPGSVTLALPASSRRPATI